MNKLELMNLKLRYFKGLQKFDLVVNGKDTKIIGDNGAGKTTVFDSMTYLLYDKDSENKSPKAFGIKTVDKKGKPLEGVEHDVEGVFQYGRITFTLRKVYKEVWTKKRGSVIAECTGNTTDYYFDGVSMNESEYQEKVDKIISEKKFKLLTNPRYFSEMTKDYKERREILLDACGDISDEDIIAQNVSLKLLPSILDGKSVDDRTRIIHSRRTAINDDIKSIPDRIDEVRRGMVDLTGLDEERLVQDIAKLKLDGEELNAKLGRIKSGGEITTKRNEILVINGEMLELKNNFDNTAQIDIAAKQTENHQVLSKINNVTFDIQNREQQIKRNENAITIKNQEKGTCLSKWYEENQRVFTSNHPADCAACGQSLPADQVQAAHDKAEANFNEEKANNLEAINAKGKGLASEIKRLELDNLTLTSEIDSLNISLQFLKDSSRMLVTEIDKLQDARKDVEMEPFYIAKLDQKAKLEREIKQLESDVEQSVWDVKGFIAQNNDKVTALEVEKAKFGQSVQQLARITELKEQEQLLSKEYEQTEHDLWIIAEFTKQKVSMLESKINSRFQYTRFKLFEVQQNGGIKDVCEATNLEGVPYNAGLNNAGRLTCGMDIINVLAERFDLAPPVVVDNAEGIVRPIKTHGQQILLIVPPTFDSLPLEVQERLISSYGSADKAKTACEEQNKKLRVESVEEELDLFNTRRAM